MRITSNLIIFLVLIVGGIFLQIFFSKKQNKWFGRILPIITFTLSVLITLTYLLSFMAGTSIWQICVTLLLTFVMYNIPTVILFVIFKACREKFKKNSQIDKMNIQDLE